MARGFGDDLEDPTEDTDKNPVPQIARRKLTLPKPDDFDDDPTPVPAPRATQPPAPKLVIEPAQPKRIAVFRVKPERSGSRMLLAVVGLLMSTIIVVFVAAPDGSSRREIARDQLRADGSGQKTESFRDWFSLGSSSDAPAERIVESPGPRFTRPAPQRKRHAQVLSKKAEPVERREEPFNFKRIEQPKRHYDNHDTSREMGSGIPMLMVFTSPPGMDVEVDGQLVGMSPVMRMLPKDTKRVKVRLHGAGFRDWEQTVSANEIDQFKVGVTMERLAE